MKIGVVNRANRNSNTGLESFEEGVVPFLLEDERFEPIDYSFRGGARAITTEYFLGRKVRKANKKNQYDAIFVPTHTQMMNIDPEDIGTTVIPYIHDMLVLSSAFYNYIYNLKGRLWIKNILECENIFAASHFTAKDLRERAGYTGDITVVYQGAGLKPADTPIAYHNRPIDLLYVGEMKRRKDPESLKQMADLSQDEGIKMVAVNREKLDLNCEQHIDISNKELQHLYDKTKYYFHPSFIEGFGRCPIEAQSRGTVPIARDNDINNEILDDAFLPYDSPRSALTHIRSTDENKWQTLSEKSIQNSKRFNFQDTATQIKRFLVESVT